MEKHIARLHAARFALRTMEARLRAQTTHFSPAPSTHDDSVLMGSADDKVLLHRDVDTDSESSEVGNDSDTEQI
jgi:hypothetical protein